ncbi:MAG: serine hydrolase domain-containing protein, partial [Terriglobia bacterium]
KVPGGGLVATAIDLARFAIAVNTGVLLEKESLEQMWTRQQTAADRKTLYGLGWSVRDYDARRVITHGGGQAGTSTFLALLPDTGTAVAVMCNLERVPIGNIAEKIFVVLMPLPEEPAGNESQPPGAQP